MKIPGTPSLCRGTRGRLLVSAGGLVIIALLVGVFVFERAFAPVRAPGGLAGSLRAAAEHDSRSGELPDFRDVTPFDTGYPAVAKLDVRLRRALQDAATDAREDGIELRINSGWRSKRYQQRLLEQRVQEYGSRAEALKVVDTPRESTHVTGDAVDIGPTDAAEWLDRNGNDYGICRVFANEAWHFELSTTRGGKCPPLRADAAAE